MGLMDNLGGLTGMLGSSGNQQGAMAQQLVSMLTSGEGGGLQGLVQQFHASGLGNIVSSWVGTGQNLPISADQVTRALGPQQTQQLASAAGVAPEHAAGMLAQLLPMVVDKMTPNGAVPAQGDVVAQASSLLGQFLKG